MCSPHTTVYLLGSIHFARRDIYPLASVIENAFDKSTVLVIEADIHNLDVNEVKGLAKMKFTYGSQTLKDNISPKIYRLVQGYYLNAG